MLGTRPRPASPLAGLAESGQTMGIIVTDERGLVSSFSSNIEELGFRAAPERIGRHWTELFPSYRRIPTPSGNGEDFVVMLEPSRRAFHVARCPLVGKGGGAFLVLRPFQQAPEAGGDINHLAILNELAAGVAHEINNPLTTISGWMQIFLADAREGDPVRQQFESIQEELDRIAHIVDKLLAFAQKPSSEYTLLDVNELVRNVVSFLEYQMRDAGVKMTTDLSRDVPAVQGSAGELKQVFLNLSINARQAMAGDGTLTISSRVAHGGGWVEIRFRDTGHGVAPEVRDRLFEPHVTTRAAEGGSGLGLSVSHEIVERMGGQLTLESTSSSGSVFLLRLPVPMTA